MLDRNASTSTHVAFKIWSLLCSFLLQVAITYDPSNMYQLSKLRYGHVVRIYCWCIFQILELLMPQEAQLGAAEEDRLARWLHSLCAFARLADQRLHVYRPGTRRHQEERYLNCNRCALACCTDKHINKAMVHVSFYRNSKPASMISSPYLTLVWSGLIDGCWEHLKLYCSLSPHMCHSCEVRWMVLMARQYSVDFCVSTAFADSRFEVCRALILN